MNNSCPSDVPNDQSFIVVARQARLLSRQFFVSIGMCFLSYSCQKDGVSTKESAAPSQPGSTTSPLPSDDPSRRGGSTEPTVKGAPIELPDSLGTPRTYFQTRSDLLFPIEIYDLQTGDSLELKQKNSGLSLLATELPTGFSATANDKNPRFFVERDDYSLGTAPQLGDTLGYDLIVRLAPRILIQEKRLSYGENPLHLLLRTQTQDIEATRSITIRDFDYFALGTSVFADPTLGQRTNRYQGRTSWVVKPMVTSSNSTLSIGTVSILNK